MNVQVGKLVWSQDGRRILRADPVIQFQGRSFTPQPYNYPVTMVGGGPTHPDRH